MFSPKSPSIILTVLLNDLRTKMPRSPEGVFVAFTFLLRISSKAVIVTEHQLASSRHQLAWNWAEKMA